MLLEEPLIKGKGLSWFNQTRQGRTQGAQVLLLLGPAPDTLADPYDRLHRRALALGGEGLGQLKDLGLIGLSDLRDLSHCGWRSLTCNRTRGKHHSNQPTIQCTLMSSNAPLLFSRLGFSPIK